jgi:hypothetical protein
MVMDFYCEIHFSNISVFHHSPEGRVLCRSQTDWGEAPILSSSAFGQMAIKKQSADVKVKPYLFFSVINAKYVEGWRNRQGKQALLHYK